MSEENVEVVRRFIEAYNRRDWEAVLKEAAPGFEFDYSRAVGPISGVFGLDQARGIMDDLVEYWESDRIEPQQFIEAGEHVVVPWTWHVVGRDGIEVQARSTWAFTIRDEAIARIAMYQERQQALEAVGLRK